MLVVAHPTIGDVVCLAPLPGWIRSLWPKCSVTVLTSEVSASLARLWPGVDEVGVRPSGLLEQGQFVARLRSGRFDLVLPTYRQNTALRLARLGGVPALTVGYPTTPPGAWANEPYLDHEPETPGALERLFKGLGADTRSPGPWLRPPPASEAEADRRLGAGRWLAVMVGASHPAKQWPLERFRAVAAAATAGGYRCVFVGGPADAVTSREAAAEGSLVLAGEVDLLATAAILARCERLVTNDTGVMHLARAVGTPVVAVLGPTPAWHFTGLGPPDVILRGACPWACGGYEACRRECLAGVSVSEVVAALGLGGAVSA